MKVENLLDDMLTAMGYNPALCGYDTAAECRGVSLRSRLRKEVERRAAEAVLSTPVRELTGWRRWPAAEIIPDDSGRGVLPLPDDFLMLLSLRLSSWERPVRDILHPSMWLYRLQNCRWSGLRGTPQRPLAFFTADDDGRRALELFTVGKDPATVAEGWYMPAPRISGDEIEIPPAAYHTLIAASVAT